MASGFVAGAKKIAQRTEPRIITLAGSETGLKQILLREVKQRENIEYVDYSNQLDLYRSGFRGSGTKVVVINDATQIKSWNWLPAWLSTVRGIQIVAITDNEFTVGLIESKARTRGQTIRCEAPTGVQAQTKFVKVLSALYGQSSTQLNILLNHNDWKVTECLQLLDKLRLLGLPLSLDTVAYLGVMHKSSDEFVYCMQSGQTAKAITIIPRLSVSEQIDCVFRLSEWLGLITRIKLASGFMKPSAQVAMEVGTDKATVEKFRKIARYLDMKTINNAGLALAHADVHFGRGYTDGVLELMVNCWNG